MDLFTFIIAIVLISILIFYQQNWMVFLVLVLMIFSLRSLTMIVFLLLSTFVLFLIQGTEMAVLWPVVAAVLILLALLIGLRPAEEAPPEYYAPGGEGLGGLLEGLQ